MASLRVAAASWEVRQIPNLQAFLDHCTDLVSQAIEQGAQLVVLPESIDLERISYHGIVPQDQVARTLAPDFPEVRAHFEFLSRTHSVTILAGTHIHELNDAFYNSALICTPSGSVTQSKNVLTQWELAEWQIQGGNGLTFDSHLEFGTMVCYDSEFPPAARALCEAGAKFLAVPAYTEVRRGFNRVRWSCHARTVECQTFVIHASLVGSLGREPVTTTFGSSAILCPSVAPFNETGILAETPFNQEAIAIADIDLDLIDIARDGDDVRNWHDRDRGNWTVTEFRPTQP
jgi:predicted amidohydrolase